MKAFCIVSSAKLRMVLTCIMASFTLGMNAHVYVDNTLPADYVKPFESDEFDYSYANFHDNFSYTYENAAGVMVTVPLTTPATTVNMMKALLKEVYTNRNIPGRKWVHGNEFVDYHPSESACTSYGLDPEADYTPIHDGMTCLLVEGIPTAGYTNVGESPFQEIKSITLVTSRQALPDNVCNGGLENPGYLFNIRKPLYKFYFITKGKARRSNSYPLHNLFEEYSPNDGDHLSAPKTVYKEIMAGKPYHVTHDCSTVVYNRGHIMEMETQENTAANISLSIFIPHFRSYQDDLNPPTDLTGTAGTTRYTWYDARRRPFFYVYSCTLDAVADAIPGDPDNYMVTLTWHTNFRDHFNVSNIGDFRLYPVVDNVADLNNPIAPESTDQEETTIDGIVVKSYANGDTRASFRVPVTETSRYLRYIVAAKLDGFETPYTFSNLDRVLIPSSNENMIIEIYGSGNSKFKASEGTNTYNNRVRSFNRNDSRAITFNDFCGGCTLTSSNRWNTPMNIHTLNDNYLLICRDNEPIFKIVPARYSPGLVDAENQWYNYITGHVKTMDDKFVKSDFTVTDDATTPESQLCMVRWRAKRSGQVGDNNVDLSEPIVNNNAAKGPLLVDVQDIYTIPVKNDNSHPTSYKYTMYLCNSSGTRLKKSNNEEVLIHKSDVMVQPHTFTLDEVIADEADYKLSPKSLDVAVRVKNHAYVRGYTIRLSDNDTDDGIIAAVSNDLGQVAASVKTLDNEGSILEQVGDVIELSAGEETYVSIPLNNALTEAQIQGVMDGTVKLVSEIIVQPTTPSTDEEDIVYDTFGTPATIPVQLPTVSISKMEVLDNRVAGSQYTRATQKTIVTDLSQYDGTDYVLPMVSHYAVWRDSNGDGVENELVNSWNNSQGESWRDNLTYTGILNYTDDRTTAVHFDGFDNKDQMSYRVRAYIKAVPSATSRIGDGRFYAPQPQTRDNTPRYIIAETTGTAYYQGHSTTGVESVSATDCELDVTCDNGSVIVSGNGPIAIYTIAGTCVATFNGGDVNATLTDLASGMYIATNGTKSVKFIK